MMHPIVKFRSQLADRRHSRPAWKACMGRLVGLAIFIAANIFLRQRITRLWKIDLPSHGLPCQHVSVTCLVCRMAWLTRYRVLIGTTGSLICLSTLTLKQHTLVDVVAGLLLAGLCGIVAEKWQQAEVSHGCV